MTARTKIATGLLLLLVVLSVPQASYAKRWVIGDFSEQPQPGVLPVHWQPLVFDGVERHTIYTHVVDDQGNGVIQAQSTNSSSGFVRKIQLDPAQWPRVSWRWKIHNVLKTADLSQKKGDDAPARLYITFAYDASEVGWWEKVKFEAIRLFYGEYPPMGALMYVWSSRAEQGAVMESPYTGRVKVIVVQTGAAKAGQWLVQQRDIRADYLHAFGVRSVPMISGVAIMTDTDNTGEQASAWYGDIVFESPQ